MRTYRHTDNEQLMSEHNLSSLPDDGSTLSSTDELSPVEEQLPFPTSAEQGLSIPMTQQLGEGSAEAVRITTAALPARITDRQPTIIRGSGKKRVASGRGSVQRGRLTMIVSSVFITCLVLMAGSFIFIPIGNAGSTGSVSQVLEPLTKLVGGQSNDTVGFASQKATPTPTPTPEPEPVNTQPVFGSNGGNVTGTGDSTIDSGADDSVHLNRFYYGQCTYWANYRYHELTGVWVPWLGNAHEWAYQAAAYGWTTSAYPNPNGPSIIVLGPYAQGSYDMGHVAVVESIIDGSTVSTSNWNWPVAGVTTYVNFTYPDAGTTFIWY